MPDQTVCPARLAGWAHDEPERLALNGRGFDGVHARKRSHQCGGCEVQRERAGVKHDNYCSGWGLVAG